MAELNFPNAVSDERDLYGRQLELEKICQTLLLRQRVPIFVVGERRIGKTSLQNVAIKQVLAGEPARFREYAIEPRGIASYSQFALAILRQLAVEVTGSVGATLPLAITSIDEFEYALRGFLERLGREIIICIDEFDVIVHKLGADQPLVMGLLYRLIERTNLPIYFFFTVTSIPQEMEEEFSSTLVSISQIIELKPLSLEETSRLAEELTSDRFSWSPAALDELFRLAGGHPNFTKLLLSCLPADSATQPLPVTDELLAQAVQKAVHHPQADHVLINLYKTHLSADEKALLLFLAQRGAPVALSELEKTGRYWVAQARRLVNRHYLKLDPSGQCFDFRLAFLGEWLRSWSDFELECDEHAQLRQTLFRPEIEVDLAAKVVRVKGAEVHLSLQEFKIMRCLAAHVDQPVSRDELMEAAWDTTDGVTDQTIDTAVYRLRRRLNDQGQYIETRTGHGFILHRAILLNA